MDLNMPEMNGLQTTNVLRQLHSEGVIRLSDTKIILYSCLANTTDLLILKENFDDVVSKPIDVENLRQLLSKYQLI